MLETARCVLRAPDEADLAFVAALYQDADVRAYLGGALEPHAAIVAAQRLMMSRADNHLWVARIVSEQLLCGVVILGPHVDRRKMEISYMFAQQAWGRGLAHECVATVLSHAHGALGIPAVLAETQRNNGPSRRLLERCGMHHIASLQRFGATQLLYQSSPIPRTTG
ncbi:GNAT family N-acetyltransferase [Devosia sp. BSSL-BM10]|uniref:GNAT family N-acetyltransferase n=1 Tax=Devosia litorisediminis TaxID=2829817 RepID=A0A942E782_9HYPH|nr:GNAT family N-acetyltransferase [Devosia litorisediminis]MBS3848732.1 GNAT family N-acetyltransferase [Devosia litorisediminis]